MSNEQKSIIEAAWEKRADISPATQGPIRKAIETALELLDTGQARVAEPSPDGWVVNQWLKQAVLLSFRIHPNQLMEGSAGGAPAFDKVVLNTITGKNSVSVLPACASCQVPWSAIPPISGPAWC